MHSAKLKKGTCNIRAKNSMFQIINESCSEFDTLYKRATEIDEAKLRLLVAKQNKLDV